MAVKCEVCGRPWQYHPGPMQMCAEIQKLRAKLEQSAVEMANRLQPCGHGFRWLAARNPVAKTSDKYCVFCETADARKAAVSLYAAMLAGISREEIVRSALEKWPWLDHIPDAGKMGPEHSSEATKQSNETCDKCGREFPSLPREEHPEGILWCAACAAEEMERATDNHN